MNISQNFGFSEYKFPNTLNLKTNYSKEYYLARWPGFQLSFLSFLSYKNFEYESLTSSMSSLKPPFGEEHSLEHHNNLIGCQMLTVTE